MVKRKFIALLVLVLMLFTCLPGCAKVIDTKSTVVEAIVVDTHHKSAWTQRIYTGKTWIIRHHRAKYQVMLKYKDYKTTIDNKDLYDQYKDNIGAIVECNLVTTYYDDGTIKTELEWENNND